MAGSRGRVIWPRLTLLIALSLPAALGGWIPVWGQGRQQPPTPESRPTVYDPDLSTCNQELIRAAFHQQLQPFADQSEAVLGRLRQIQLEMTTKTISRCVKRQLLSPEQAAQLSRELAESPTRP